MRKILVEDVPAWYEFSWNSSAKSILLRIHHEALARNLFSNLQSAPLVEDLRSSLNLQEFHSEGPDLGFDGVFKRTGEKDSFEEFSIPLPLVRQVSEEQCSDCDGAGWDKKLDMPCFLCKGGKKTTHNWRSASAISATLSIMLRWLLVFEGDTKAAVPQLLTVQTMIVHDMNGASLGGDYSKALVRWLCTMEPHTPIPMMQNAMREAWQTMMGDKNRFNRFEARVDSLNGWLNVSCPGDACGLHPADGSLRPGRGYPFSSHNVDSPAQQLTLVAGLAALHDQVRAEL